MRTSGATTVTLMHRGAWMRRFQLLVITAAVIVLPASPASAAQVFSQFDVIVRTHIYETPADDDRVVERPATARIRITDLSRELTDDEIRGLEAEVPDPLNDLCFEPPRDPAFESGGGTGSESGSKTNECPASEMEGALEQRASGLLMQLPDFEFGEVSAHVAVRRDDGGPLRMVAPVLLVLGLPSLRRRGTSGRPRVTGSLRKFPRLPRLP